MALTKHPMQRLVALAILFAGLTGTGHAGAILVSGSVAGEWTPDMSPVIAYGDCVVAPGASLVLRPGVQVFLDPGVTIRVQGSFSALGTTDRPIEMVASSPATGPWRGLHITATGQAILSDCVVRDGGLSDTGENTGMLRVDGGRLTLTRCDVIASRSSGVFLNGGSLNASSSRFLANGGTHPTDAGIHVVTGSVTLATGDLANTVTNSVFGLYNDDINPVDARGTWWGSASGPQHTSNVLGQGVSVSDDVLYEGFVTVNPQPTRGDIDRDGHVTLRDATLALRMAGGLSPASPFARQVGDVAPNGRLDLCDAQILIRAATGAAPLP